MQIKLLVEGGNLSPGPSLSQKLGPMGLNINKVIQKVNEATNEFKGLKVPVELDINSSTKKFDVKVFSPPVSELLKKELGIEKGSGIHKKIQAANASIEQIISVAKTKLPDLLSKNLKLALKTVVGTCVSLGILIENKPAVEIEKEIDDGVYDKEIQEEKTETSQEKKDKLDEFLSKLKAEQELIMRKEEQQQEAAKEAESAEKVEETKKEGDKEEEKKEEKTAKK